MKEILALLLAAVMCFSLVACGNEETPPSNDNGGIHQGGTTENAENSNTGNAEGPHTNHPLLPHIYGEWKQFEIDNYFQDEKIPCSTLTINADGTCVVDGISGTWLFSDKTRDDLLRINIFIGSEHLCCVGYFANIATIAVWSASYPEGGPLDFCWKNTSDSG